MPELASVAPRRIETARRPESENAPFAEIGRAIHGGTVEARSPGLGLGSELTAILPVSVLERPPISVTPELLGTLSARRGDEQG